MDTKIDTLLYYMERMNLKEKEIFFWKYFKTIKYDKLLFDSFSREEIKEKLGKDLTEEEYQYLKDNFEIEYSALEQSVIILIEDALFDRNYKYGNK